MRFHIPFTIANSEKLKRSSRFFIIKTRLKQSSKDTNLKQYLNNAESGLDAEEYRAITRRSFVLFFVILIIISTTSLVLLRIRNAYFLSFLLSLAFSIFIFFSQTIYPRVYDKKRVRNLERNLIPALEDMLVQLNSGIPLFNIIVNISDSDYNELSSEFKKAARRINAGIPEVEVLEQLGEKNSSIYFKRTLWQISNGMKAGSDISLVIKEGIKSLYGEQLLQIQTYGNKLNPLIMFYLLASVILPSLSLTFLTIISSMLNITTPVTISMFFGLFILVALMQIMLLGMIRSIRPTLL